MKKYLLAFLIFLLTLVPALAQPGPTPSPFYQNGAAIAPLSSTSCFTFPANVTGGCMGNGTANFSGVYVNGSTIQGTGLPYTQIWIGDILGVAAAHQMSGDCTLSSAGVISCSSVSGIVAGTTTVSGTTHNNGLFYNSGNVFTNLATANSSVLVTNGSGVPSISTTLPPVDASQTAATLTVSASAYSGFDPTGVTDSTAAVQACLNALGSTGGICAIPKNAKVKLNSANITVPTKVTLQCGLAMSDITSNTDTSFANWSHIQLASAYTFLNSGKISDCLIYRDGMTFPVADSSAFAGTAITMSADGAATSNLMVLGFATALTSSGYSRIRMEGKFYADATASSGDAAILLNNSFDSSYVADVHLWPFSSVGYNGGSPPDSALQRPGTGFKTTGQSDDTFIDNLFAYGYKTNINLGSNGNVNIKRAWVDYTTTSAGGQIGFETTGSLNKVQIQSIFAYSGDNPVYFNHTSGFVSVGQIVAAFSLANNVNLITGNTYIGQLQTTNATQYGVAGANTVASYQVRVSSGYAASNGISPAVAVPSGATAATWDVNIQTDQVAGASRYGVNNVLFDTVASAGSLAPPVNANTVEVTGTTDVTSIQGAWGGRILTLKFDGVLTVHNGGNISLQSGSNFTTSAGATLVLMYDAANSTWIELSRSPITSASSIVSGVTPATGFTNGHVVGVSGGTTTDFGVSGTGTTVALVAAPALVTPTATTLQVGGASIASNYTLTGTGAALFQNGINQTYVDLFGTGSSVPRFYVGSTSTNGIVGATTQGCSYLSCGAQFPSGVEGYGNLLLGSDGNTAYGVSGLTVLSAATGNAFNEFDAFNNSGAASNTTLPPNTVAGTSDVNAIALVLNTGGTGDGASIGLYVANPGNSTRFNAAGIYLHPHASDNYQIAVGGDTNSTGTGLFIQRGNNGGAGKHIHLANVTTDSASSAAVDFANASAVTTWRINQGGSAAFQPSGAPTTFDTPSVLGVYPTALGSAVLTIAQGGVTNPYQMVLGINTGLARIQASQGGVGVTSLQLNPDGGNVAIGGALVYGGVTLDNSFTGSAGSSMVGSLNPTFNSTTESTSSATGGVLLSGGIGIAKTASLGGGLEVYGCNATTTNGQGNGTGLVLSYGCSTGPGAATIFSINSGVAWQDLRIDGANLVFNSQSSGNLQFTSLTTDSGHTTRTVCQDTTSKNIFFGSGTGGVCAGTSSARFKTNIVSDSLGLSKVADLKPVAFNYKKGYGDDGARRQHGFLAEDVVKVLPDLVGLDKDGKPNSVDMLGMVPVLVNAIKELKVANDNLAAQVADLKRAVSK